MKIRIFLPICFLCALVFIPAAASLAVAQNAALDDARIEKKGDFFIAKNGNDAWSGTLSAPNPDGTDGPFATFEKAREAVRQALKAAPRPITVQVHGGIYKLNSTFLLGKDDSGKDGARVTWQAMMGEEVRLSGGKYLNAWKVVDDPEILRQLPESVRGKIIQIDLKAEGLNEYGSPKGEGMELFFDGEPMRISRYPNEGFLKIVSVDVNQPKDVRGTKGDQVGNFQFDDDHLLTWEAEKDPWVHGYWFWDWAEERHPIAEIAKETRTLKVKPPYHNYGYRKGQWFYAFNLLCEIDLPGEYFIDREKGILYFYPPKEITKDSLVVSVLDRIVKLENTEFITLQGFTMEYCRSCAVSCSGKDDLIVGLTVRNVSGAGITGNGKNLTIYGNHLFNLGKSALSITGGSRETLEPSGNLVSNNEIHSYGRVQRIFAVGVGVYGVGNVITHNKIYDAPHMGIFFSGNEHRMEFNEIFNVCYESNDAGAIYAGRDWAMRGNVLRFNYLHDIQGFEKRGCVGIYLDDMFSSAEIFGNIFVNVCRATMIGGGRDTKITNNIYVNCKPCVHLDARALGWAKPCMDGWIKELEEKGTHLGRKILEPPYSTRYPELTTILANHPGTPVGNVISTNVCVGGNFGGTRNGQQWQGTSIWQKAPEFNTIEKNLTEEDPMIEDWEHGNFTLKPNSPALKMGFQQIPWQEIGLTDDSLRAR